MTAESRDDTFLTICKENLGRAREACPEIADGTSDEPESLTIVARNAYKAFVEASEAYEKGNPPLVDDVNNRNYGTPKSPLAIALSSVFGFTVSSDYAVKNPKSYAALKALQPIANAIMTLNNSTSQSERSVMPQ